MRPRAPATASWIVIMFACIAFPLAATARAVDGAKAEDDFATPVAVTLIPTPTIPRPHFSTSGRYLQLSSAGPTTTIVNRALVAAVLADEEEFATSDPSYLKQHDLEWGFSYKLDPQRRLISASTIVVSALLPATRLFRGGTQGSGWLSVTISVHTGRRVRIRDLFKDVDAGIRALANATRKELEATSVGFKRISQEPLFETTYGMHLRPTEANFQEFALTDSGFAVGFTQDTISYPVAGRIFTIIPYSTLQPYFNTLAKNLIRGVVRPKSFANS